MKRKDEYRRKSGPRRGRVVKTFSFVLSTDLVKMLHEEAEYEIRTMSLQLEYLLARHYRRKTSSLRGWKDRRMRYFRGGK